MKTLISDVKNGTSYSIDYLLNNDVYETLSKKGIRIRKVFSPLLRFIYGFKTDYKLVVDSREKLNNKDKKGTIFVVNHRQSDDVVLGVNVIKKSGYVVFGNPNLVLETPNGLGLWAHGVIVFNRDDKYSRESTYDKMKYVIENNGNIIIWAEGYWNLDDNGIGDMKHGSDDHNSENWLIQDFNLGVFRLAKETGATMVPVTLHYDEIGSKKCYANRGNAFKVGKNDDLISKKDEFKTIMQSTYYELMEKYSSYKRKELESNGKTLKQQWQELKEELVATCDIKRIGYKLDLNDEKLIGKAKVVNPVITNEEAFEHLYKINYNIDNSFLLSKNITGRRK